MSCILALSLLSMGWFHATSEYPPTFYFVFWCQFVFSFSLVFLVFWCQFSLFLYKAYSLHFIDFFKNFTDFELAEMPSCNLSETVHNKWLQQSGNRGSDLYVATVDDFVRAFMQCTNYYAYLKGDRSGTGPGKEELRLRAAQRSGDAKRIVATLEHMPGAEHWCTRKPQLKGGEGFGTTKHKLDMPLVLIKIHIDPTRSASLIQVNQGTY
jgi:hypothetical protein